MADRKMNLNFPATHFPASLTRSPLLSCFGCQVGPTCPPSAVLLRRTGRSATTTALVEGWIGEIGKARGRIQARRTGSNRLTWPHVSDPENPGSAPAGFAALGRRISSPGRIQRARAAHRIDSGHRHRWPQQGRYQETRVFGPGDTVECVGLPGIRLDVSTLFG